MFNRAILDTNADLTLEQKRFYGCIRLVADNTLPAVFYVNSDWSKRRILHETGLKQADLLHLLKGQGREIPENLRRTLKELLPKNDADGKEPRLICLEDGSWKLPKSEDGGRPFVSIRDEFVLSPSKVVNQAALLDQGFNANSAVLCLAAAGVDLVLPNIAVDLLAEDEIFDIREKFEEERTEYIIAVTALSRAAVAACQNGDFDGVLRWARNEATFSIVPKARAYEIAVSKHTKNVLKTAGYSLWKNGVPAIGAAYLSGGVVPAASVTGAQILQSLIQATTIGKFSKSVPEVSYAMKIRAELD